MAQIDSTCFTETCLNGRLLTRTSSEELAGFDVEVQDWIHSHFCYDKDSVLQFCFLRPLSTNYLHPYAQR